MYLNNGRAKRSEKGLLTPENCVVAFIDHQPQMLSGTLEKAKAAGVSVLDGPFSSDGRDSAMVQFPGGYIAEIHSKVSEK